MDTSALLKLPASLEPPFPMQRLSDGTAVFPVTATFTYATDISVALGRVRQVMLDVGIVAESAPDARTTHLVRSQHHVALAQFKEAVAFDLGECFEKSVARAVSDSRGVFVFPEEHHFESATYVEALKELEDVGFWISREELLALGLTVWTSREEFLNSAAE